MSSTPAAAVVMSASVVSGLISEMLATVVVLPTPKPPAMTILTGSGGRRPAAGGDSADRAETTDHPQQRVDVRRCVGVRQVDGQVALRGQVADQYADHSQVQRQLRGDLGDRQRIAAECRNVAALESEPVGRLAPLL